MIYSNERKTAYDLFYPERPFWKVIYDNSERALAALKKKSPGPVKHRQSRLDRKLIAAIEERDRV